MPLQPGHRFGPYEIVAPLGAGGMGEVYKARDTRLDRSVAIKVLPEHIALREDSRARFEREARAVASLNHPNICTLHDIGSQDGAGYMVMEYIEGETLASRLERGPMPLDEAVALAIRIADALDRAHRAGVAHRDVKPGNLMLTRDGVKVLDFGLAKSMSASTSTAGDATLTQALTGEGAVLGTPQYMAPEQFEGREADVRSDVWAFGAVLCEMVTGKKAFEGANYAGLVGAILAKDPPALAPAWLDRLVRRCLAKSPEDRYQSMRDIVLDLQSPPADAAPAGEGAKPGRLPWVVAAAAVAVAAVLGSAIWLRPAAPRETTALEVSPPAGASFAGISTTGGSALSPDGRTLAFIAGIPGNPSRLYVRQVESLHARALEGTEISGRPFWSPDSKSIAFGGDGKLKRIEVAGGAPIELCPMNNPRGGDWNSQGVILFGMQGAGLQRIAATGGRPEPVTQIDRAAGETSHYYPQFLPGGKRFLFLVRNDNPEKSGIYVASLEGGERVKLVASHFRAVYDAESGRLLYMQSPGQLMARRMQLDPPALAGDSVVVAEGVGYSPPNGYVDVSAANGSLFYGRNDAITSLRMAWRDRSGKDLGTVKEQILSGGPYGLALSPDDSKVAYTALIGARDDVFVLDLARGVNTRLSFLGGISAYWTRDGRTLYYSRMNGVHRRAADGSGQEEAVIPGPQAAWVRGFTPDGRVAVYGQNDIFTVSLDGTRKTEVYLQTGYNETANGLSPDGRWLAYTSNESGRNEIYVQGFPDRRGKWQVSANGGTAAQWRADGRELFWRGQDNLVMATQIELGAQSVRIGRTEALFSSSRSFSAARDGQRFLVLDLDRNQKPQLPMVLMQNWAARLPQ